MTRIEEVPENTVNPIVRTAYAISKRQYGMVPTPLKLFARRPLLLEGYGAFEWAFGRAGKLDARVKALVQIKAAAIIGCEYCLDIGSFEGGENGVTAEQVVELPRYRDSEHFSEAEKVALDYAVAMTLTPVDVPDALFEQVRAQFDEDQIVELTTAIALENFRGRFNWALDISPQGYAEGAVCATKESPPAAATA